ncbi:hypothetical protein [Methylopila sp. M107]|uniref:hypothetical protein n=1 Tax=Methylopila sp. M107 TaxID=1101190 RepID=UPI00036CBC62|nr:hypothetical protein [Methylopila sp. M107]
MIEPGSASWKDAAAVPTDDDYDPDAIFELIERTAETMRALQENEQAIAAREQSFQVKFERERASWRGDLEELRRTVEACLERATTAEQETAEVRSQAKQALALCDETRSREAAAVKRLEAAEARARLAEERFAQLEAFLSKNFSQFAMRRTG